MPKKKRARVLAILTACIMMVLVVEPVCATTISDLEDQKKELEDQKRQADERRRQEQARYESAAGAVSAIQSDVDAVAEEIDEIDAALVEIIASVELIEEDIARKEEQIETTTGELEEAQEIERQQYEAMKLRIRFMYEKGDTTYLQLLLESQGFSDMINKAEYIEKLYDYDREKLLEYQEAREAVERLKEQLEEEMSELEAQHHELEEEQESLEIMLAQRKETYENYEIQLAQARQEAAIYKANIKKQNEEIKRLEAEAANKQSQIDAARRAEEEARRAQELALQNQQSASSQGGSSGTTASAGSSYASASSYSGTGSKGQQIANYACQFIGNPYVPGGTSLTQGADCSGFVWRVYKDFGYSLPRTSYDLRSAGSGVSYSNAQPGDIMCYAGHVGIYIGNGQIVHASTQKTGIKITAATYKEILSVRRIV